MMRLSTVATAALLGLALAVPAQKQEKKKDYGAEAARTEADAAFQSQDFAKAVAAYRTVLKADDQDGQAWHRLGFSLHALGELDEALEAHKRASKFPSVAPVATYNIACVYALREDKEQALAWLQKAVEAGFGNADHVATDTDMDNLRDDPRFEKIVAAMAEAPAQIRAFTNATPRSSARLFLWGGSGSAGQVVVDHGLPPWKESYGEALDSADSVGKRWRFGANFWTTLDTNVDLSIGGKEIAAGYYYLALENKGDGKVALVLLDPAKVRKKKLDAFQIDNTGAGTEVALAHEEVDEVAEKLQITLQGNADNPGKAKLVIRFGPHQLSAGVKLHLQQ